MRLDRAFLGAALSGALMGATHCAGGADTADASSAGGGAGDGGGGAASSQGNGGAAGAPGTGGAGGAGGGGTGGAGGGGTGGEGGSVDPEAFPEVLDGIWLIGWAGGARHYSWVRFTVIQKANGKAQFLSGDDLQSNIPFWPCSGEGSWSLSAKPKTVQIVPPAACGQPPTQAYTFHSIAPANGPKGAILSTPIEGNPAVQFPLEGFKFPDDQCDAAMTSCTDPFL